MSLTKEEFKEINELAEPTSIFSYFRKVICFFGFLILPMGAAIWMEFFKGPDKIDNVLVVFMVVSIVLSFFVQFVLFVLTIVFIIGGNDIIKDAIEKEEKDKDKDKKGNMAKNLAKTTILTRISVFSILRLLMFFILVGLLIYIGHVILGAILLSLSISQLILKSFMSNIFGEHVKKHFLSKKSEEVGEKNER